MPLSLPSNKEAQVQRRRFEGGLGDSVSHISYRTAERMKSDPLLLLGRHCRASRCSVHDSL